jgi:predicted transcriptional regulator
MPFARVMFHTVRKGNCVLNRYEINPNCNKTRRRRIMMVLGEHTIIDVPVCTEDVHLDQVYEMLCRSGERIVIVVDSNAHQVPIGVVTDRSICDQVLGRRRDPRGLTAANVLDSKIKKLRRANIMASSIEPIESGSQPVIVVDRDRKVVGLYAGARNANDHPPHMIAPTADFSAPVPASVA